MHPRKAATPAGGIPLPMGALEALGAIDAVLGALVDNPSGG
jgi:hypothetical protein